MKVFSRSLSNSKRTQWMLTFACASCWAYALVARYTHFFMAPRLEKMLLILTALLITLTISFFIIHDILPKIIGSPSNRQILTSSALSFLSTVLIMMFFYQLPHFPQNHRLEIHPIYKDQLPFGTNQLEIISITRIEQPGNRRVFDSPTELIPSSAWEISPETSNILWTGESDASIFYSRFMQAGVEILFRSGPQQGLTRIIWDDQEIILDLKAPAEGSTNQIFLPSTSWRGADTTRKWLVGAAFLADSIGLFVFLNILCLFFYSAFFKQGLYLRSVKFITISCTLLLLFYPVMTQLNPSIEFSDAGLESAIRDILGIDHDVIHQHDILSIVKLDASGMEITELDGIQRLRNLTSLNLAHNNISDISPLGSLPKLRELDISNNSISDISSLSALSNLESLNLRSNLVSDITSLEKLSHLQDLNLRQNNIKDISSLSTLSKIKKLNLRANRIHDISTIENLIELRELNLRQNYISDISFLNNLEKLKTLNLRANKISDIAPLFNLKKLIELNLGENRLSNINILSQLTSLESLNLKNNSISEISALSNLSKIKELNLGGNSLITSIKPLANLTELRSLNLRDIPIGSQVDVLKNFHKLSALSIRNCSITDVAPIVFLMVQGSLQDDLLSGLMAELDIRENPISRQPMDGYSHLRPLWKNISIRLPLTLPVYHTLTSPVFSHQSGFYHTPFFLSLTTSDPESSIHFTLDGSQPSPDSFLYTEPIPIEYRGNQSNQLSLINTTSYDWQEPLGEVFKATVVRAASFHKDGSSSPVITNTYFIDESMPTRYKLPIISIATDSDYFFDPHFGIYVLGAYWDKNHNPIQFPLFAKPANFYQRGLRWEHPINFELFDTSGELLFNSPAGVRIHGGITRRYPQKSLRIIANSWYGSEDYFNFEFFPDATMPTNQEILSEYKTLILRNSGNDWRHSMFKDAFIHSLVKHTNLDIQAYRPVILFLNGEYWGIHNMRERMDAHYLATRYHLSPDNFVILEDNSSLVSGLPGDENVFEELIDYLSVHNANDKEVFDIVETQMDIDNYIEYLVTQIFICNTDWPHNNVKYWRFKNNGYDPDAVYGLDGRWRWFLFDTDYGFRYVENGDSFQHNTLLHALEQTGEKAWSSFLFKSLIKNEQFRQKLLNSFADHFNTSFDPQRVIGVINEMQAVIAPEMPEHIRRWRTMDNSVAVWEENVEVMRTFARHRPDYVRQHLMEYFHLPGTAQITLQSDPSMGYIRINSIDITSDTPGVTDPANWRGVYFQGIPVTITAIPNPGFRFASWQGSSQEEPSITLIPDQDFTLQAIFLPIDD